MSKLKMQLLAAAITIGSATAAFAADLPIIEERVPAPIVSSGWYLRGDVGFDVFKSVDFSQADVTAASGGFLEESIDNSGFIGIGLGYRFNDWARSDITAEFRGTENFAAVDHYRFDCDAAGLNSGSCGGGGTITRNNFWRGSLSTKMFMVNAYFDMGTYYGLTPFVGAGVGAAYHRVHGVQDFDPSDLGGGSYNTGESNWSFAWALHAGLGYEVNDRLTLEVAYRYLDMGDASSGTLCVAPSCATTLQPLKIDDIVAHDVKIGMRWNFASSGFGDSY